MTTTKDVNDPFYGSPFNSYDEAVAALDAYLAARVAEARAVLSARPKGYRGKHRRQVTR